MRRHQITPMSWYLSTKLHNVTSQKTITCIYMTVGAPTLLFDPSWLIVTEWTILEGCDWVIDKIDIIKLCLYWVCPETVKKELTYFDNSVNNILKLFYMEPYLIGHNPYGSNERKINWNWNLNCKQILVVLQP
jgi:hypothetical protein